MTLHLYNMRFLEILKILEKEVICHTQTNLIWPLKNIKYLPYKI